MNELSKLEMYSACILGIIMYGKMLIGYFLELNIH